MKVFTFLLFFLGRRRSKKLFIILFHIELMLNIFLLNITNIENNFIFGGGRGLVSMKIPLDGILLYYVTKVSKGTYINT